MLPNPCCGSLNIASGVNYSSGKPTQLWKFLNFRMVISVSFTFEKISYGKNIYNDCL
jgi:hypothetical protein